MKAKETRNGDASNTRGRDIEITNDLQWVIIKLFHPEAVGLEAFETAAPEVFARHAAHLRRILEIDGRIHSKKRLIDIWDENRGKDPRHVMAVIKKCLDILRRSELEVTAILQELDLDQPLLPFDR